MTKEQKKRFEDINAAYEFVQEHYPDFWDRVTEEDIIKLLTLGHTLYKTDPQFIEATIKSRHTPIQ